MFKGVVLHEGGVREHAEQALVAEQHGFDSVWVTEVHGPDVITVLTAASAATERISLGTGIAPIFLRDPYLAATTFGALHEYSEGRVIAGFGVSTPAIVTNWHGQTWSKPLESMREYVELFRKLTSGERLKHDNLFQTIGAPARPISKPAIPVFIGTLGNKMLELAGEIANGIILNFPTVSSSKKAIQAIEKGLYKAKRERKEIRITAFLRTVIHNDYEIAAAPLKQELLSYFMAPVYEQLFREDGYEEDCDLFLQRWNAGERNQAINGISERMIRDHAIVGQKPEECRDIAAAFKDAGIDELILYPIAPNDAPNEQEAILQTTRLFSN